MTKLLRFRGPLQPKFQPEEPSSKTIPKITVLTQMQGQLKKYLHLFLLFNAVSAKRLYLLTQYARIAGLEK